MNILVVGKRRFAEEWSAFSAAENFHEKDNVDYLENEPGTWGMVSSMPYLYNCIIVDITESVSSNGNLRRKVAEILKANQAMTAVCVTTRQFVDIGLLEGMDLSRIVFLKWPLTSGNAAELFRMLYLRMEKTAKKKERTFIVKAEGVNYYVPCSSIIFVSKARQGIRLITAESEYLYRKKMDDFEDEVRKCGVFCRCHSSYMVNFLHVSEVRTGNICMDNGKIIPVSRNYRINVKDFLER